MNHKKMGGLMSLFENHAGIMDQHSQEHNQQPISEKFVFVIIEGDHKIRVCRFELLFTKDWDFLKIIPLRFSGVLGRLSPFHHQNTHL